MHSQVQSLPMWKKIMYAMGQFGWCVASYGVQNLLNYFYMPPEGSGEQLFPTFIFQGAVVLGLTIIGLISFGGRVFDAITDPIIAGLSDRSKSKFGRRRLFLLIGALPFALTSVLVFIPIVPAQSVVNAIWIGFMIVLFYLFFTLYLTPYYALISELGHNPKERLTLSTIIAITWALGFMVGSQAYVFQGIFERVLNIPVMLPEIKSLLMNGEVYPMIVGEMQRIQTQALQIVIIIFGLIGFVGMMLPVIFINEKKYCESHVSTEGSFEAVGSALKNKNFVLFTFSDLLYYLALTIIQIGISYYVIVLLKLPKDMASFLMIILFLVSFIFYVPINLIAQKIGKKKVIIFGFISFSLGYLFIYFMGDDLSFIPNIIQGIFIMCWCAIPMGIFGILPNAVVADIAEADGIKNGNYKAGVFFGARGLIQKMGISIANLIFPSFLLLGKSVENDTGVRVSAIAALLFCLLGVAVFLRYDEKKVLSILATKEELTEEELEELKDD